MTKVIRLALICEQLDNDGNPVDHKDIYDILWNLQRQTREIKNKTVQLCWEWLNFASDYKKQNGEYPKDKDVLGYTLSGFVYDHFKTGYDLYSSNISTSSRDVCTAFKNAQKEILRGDRSVLSYKSDQPLDIYNKGINIEFTDKTFYVNLKLLNREGKKKYNISDDFRFKIVVKDRSTRTILERCVDGIYKVSASKLIYDKKKKLWCLNLSYSFENNNSLNLDENKILGVNLGIHYPICASVYGDKKRFTIDGGEIEEFRRRVEARRLSLLVQGKNCGDGRIGHGIKTRNRPAYNISDKIARFRDTTNHKYSRALIDYAIRNNCGVIQMEDLKGITKDANHFLKCWPYYDLQTKIEYKAKEAGIKVVYINPAYTSQRCSKCGYINEDNRKTQANFHCLECGFTANADYNASQNIGIQNIDAIIKTAVRK